ncbi:hypothetical protein DL98DRAFT_611862 [Cadophora sp. DSE1049]|nr:hypothetical protein DL98DRAFT_611862 [Cadophora sp. DSE1049]
MAYSNKISSHSPSARSFHQPITNSPYAHLDQVEPTILHSVVVIHDIQSGTGTPFEASAKGLTEFSAYTPPAGPRPSLLFMRGFASPRWLGTIGEKHNLSPELCRRHLEFSAFNSGARYLYSSSSHVFQLMIPTICTRNVSVSGYQPEDLQESKRLEEEAMKRCGKQLRSKSHVAGLIESGSVFCSPPGEDWRALVWLDSGKYLSKSLAGPWSPWPGTRAWETYFFPVIVHQATDLAPPVGKTPHDNSSCPTSSTSQPKYRAPTKTVKERGEQDRIYVCSLCNTVNILTKNSRIRMLCILLARSSISLHRPKCNS